MPDRGIQSAVEQTPEPRPPSLQGNPVSLQPLARAGDYVPDSGQMACNQGSAQGDLFACSKLLAEVVAFDERHQSSNGLPRLLFAEPTNVVVGAGGVQPT